MKSKISKVVATIMLGVILITVLTGCGKKEEDNTKSVQEEEKREVKLINDEKNIVYTVKEESGYRIPKINLAYDNIKAVNKEILEFGEEFIESSKLEGEIQTGGTLTYTYYENDNILSVVYEYKSPLAALADSYQVWNVDKYTGETITNEQILAKKETTVEEFETKYIEQCKLKYEELNKAAEETMKEFYTEQYDKTVSTENNNEKNKMFLDENNEINMVSKIYSLAGAEYYEHIVIVKK